GTQTVNILVAHRTLRSLAFNRNTSSSSAPAINETEVEKAVVEAALEQEETVDTTLKSRVLVDESDEHLRVQFLQDGRFLILRVHSRSSSDENEDEDGSDGEHGDVELEKEVEEDEGKWLSELEGRYPSRVIRLLNAVLKQSAVISLSPVLVVTPVPLSL